MELIEEVEEVESGISTVDASIKWSETSPTTDPPDSVNGDISRMGVLDIGCATNVLNASSFKWSGAGASKLEQRLDL